MKNRHYRKGQNEKGMSTLVVILLLLIVATLVTLYTANSNVREQQVSANQYRAGQALSAANAGLDFAFAYFTKNSGFDADADGTMDSLTVPALGNNTAVISILDPVTLAPVTDPLAHPIIISSQGFSDDRAATRTIQVEVDLFGPTLAGGLPGFPLVAKGFAGSNGNVSIINRFSNATIWTGASASSLASAETYVKDPTYNYTDRSELISIEGSPDPDHILHASYNKAGLNSDVIDGDYNLANLTNDQFFQSFMKENKQTLRSFAESIGQRYKASKNLWSQLESDGVRGVVWVDGVWAPSGPMPVIGTEKYPVTLIVNGDFDPGGGGSPAIRVIGLIYVIGNWAAGSNFAVQGGVIVEGDVVGNGNPTVVYDENLYDGSLGVPPGAIAAIVAGSWKDW